VEGFEKLRDVTYHRAVAHGTVRVAIDRPEVRNAFRPRTVDELYECLDDARRSPDVGCVLLTGNGPSPKDGGWAFCSGGDQRVRGPAGYEYDDGGPGEAGGGAHEAAVRAPGNAEAEAAGREGPAGRAYGVPSGGEAAGSADTGSAKGEPEARHQVVSLGEAAGAAGGTGEQQAASQPVRREPYSRAGGDGPEGRVTPADRARLGRLHILEVQRLIRTMPKVVIAVVPGWAAGGGHSLHVVCDLTVASAEHARFRQTDADVASFDGGYGSAYLARQVGQKRAREVFFLGRTYSAQEAYEMGMVNAVVPHESLERVALEWAAEINAKSPMSVRMLKFAFNLADDGLAGQQLFAGEATRLAYMTEEAREGRDAFLGRRRPDWSGFPWYY
jgi:naphthoate synthase